MGDDKALNVIKEIQEERVKLQQKLDYDKYSGIFDAVCKFLKSQDVLMYGGQALDELLPKHLKIYDTFTLPDIDVYSYRAKDLAIALRDALVKQGFSYSTVGDALHENTYKVFCQGLQVADITNVSKSLFTQLKKKSSKGSLGVRVIRPDFLRQQMHGVMSRPYSNDRWEKNYERLMRFYKIHPPIKTVLEPSSELEADLDRENVISDIYRFTNIRGCAHLGSYEILQILGFADTNGDFIGIPTIIALVPQLSSFMKEFQHDFAKLKVSKVQTIDYNEQIDMCMVYWKGAPLALFMEAPNCLSYIQYNGQHICTVHAIVSLCLTLSIVPNKILSPMRKHFMQVAEALSYMQLHPPAKLSRRKLLQPVESTCIGNEMGLVTMRRNRVKRRNKPKP